jgi:hypothetical protein
VRGELLWKLLVATFAQGDEMSQAKQTLLVPTDVPNPMEPGEPLYVQVAPAPLWWWLWKRISLFFGIVWRDFHGARISVATAWSVSAGIWSIAEWRQRRRWFAQAEERT